jgi:flavin reductase (DIM6/NTAB) family NADH-FMN oxidoreductase RutF
MSRSLGQALTAELLALLSQSDLEARLGRALPLITMDRAGRPHPMLLSYLEVLAVDPRTIRVAVGAGSRTAANMAERGAATLLIVEAERTVYLKCMARGAPLGIGSLACFELEVEEVLEDSPAAWEAGLAITGGITYGPPPSLDAPWVQATLAALRAGPGA